MIQCYRVWFTDGSGCLVDANNEKDARKVALMLQPPDLRATLKVARVEKLNK